jgi:hypothetical protein
MAKRKQYDHSAYLDKVATVSNLRKTITIAAKTLKKYEFDTIAFRGMSGALPAIPLALRLKKEIVKHIHKFAPEAKCIGVLLTDTSMNELRTFDVNKADKECLKFEDK